MPFLPGRLGDGQLLMARPLVITAQGADQLAWETPCCSLAQCHAHFLENSCLFGSLLVMERSPLWVLVPPVLYDDPPAWDHAISQDSPSQYTSSPCVGLGAGQGGWIRQQAPGTCLPWALERIQV